jgi:4-hydroxy-tetrahydrodipicolinate synthase
MEHIFSGMGVALITPFKKDFSIDFEGIERIIEDLIVHKTDYIVALGTTAETPTLSFSERKLILDKIVQSIHGRVPLMVGIGCNNPLEVIEQIHYFDLKKADAILSVAPYYNRPQQDGIIAHFKAIANESPLPMLIYNISSRTAVNIEAATTLRIAKEIPKVIGVKEASGNFAQIMAVMQDKPEHFHVLSGDDALTLPLLACGLDGLISVIANAFPNDISEMVHAALQGDFQKARKIHYQYLPLMNACFKEGSPSGIKTLLKAQEKIEQYVRLPLVDVSTKLKNEIESLIK